MCRKWRHVVCQIFNQRAGRVWCFRIQGCPLCRWKINVAFSFFLSFIHPYILSFFLLFFLSFFISFFLPYFPSFLLPNCFFPFSNLILPCFFLYLVYFHPTFPFACGPRNSVGIATRYGLDGSGIEPRSGARFSAPVQTDPGAHPASCTICASLFSE